MNDLSRARIHSTTVSRIHARHGIQEIIILIISVHKSKYKTSIFMLYYTNRKKTSKSSTNLPKPILRQDLLLLNTNGRLPLRGRPEEQTGTLGRPQQMTQIPPLRGVTIILNIPARRRVRQSIPKSHSLHHLTLRQLISLTLQLDTSRLQQRLTTASLRKRKRHKWVHFTIHDSLNRGLRVVPRCYGAAGGFDGCDGGSGRPRDDEVEGLFEDGGAVDASGGGRRWEGGGVDAVGEELHTFARLVDAPAIHEFADGDGAVGIDAALVDPGLDSVEVYGGEVGGESN